jgi:serine/threonine protein phosphatase PrpC
MEDIHAAVLLLDEGVENSNAFFAVYDGHGGAFPIWVSFRRPQFLIL